MDHEYPRAPVVRAVATPADRRYFGFPLATGGCPFGYPGIPVARAAGNRPGNCARPQPTLHCSGSHGDCDDRRIRLLGNAGRAFWQRSFTDTLPVVAGTLDGLQSVDPGLRELFRIYGAGRIRTWWLLGFPASLPSIFTGLRIAAGLSVIGAIVGEFVGAFGGDRAPLGAVITSALRQNHTDVVFAAIVLAAMLGFLLFGIVNFIGWVTLRRWHASAQ